MKKTVFFLFIFASALFSFRVLKEKTGNQFHFITYWQHANKEQYLLQVDSNFTAALAELQWMEKNGNDYLPAASDYADEAICYAHLKDTAKATDCLRKAVINGWTNILDMAWLQRQTGNKSFAIIKQELPGLRKKYYIAHADKIPMLIEEAKLTGVDQFVRSQRVMQLLSPKDFDTLLFITDSIDVARYITNIKTGLCGAQSWMLYHLYGDNDKYTPFVDSCMRVDLFSGKVSPEAYAMWIDRQYAWVENKPQKYGAFVTYSSFDYTKPPVIMGKLQSVDSVDYYRSQIGLPPLWQDAKKMQFDLPDGYKK